MAFNPPRIYQLFMLLILAAYFLLPASRIIEFPYNLLGLPVFFGGAYLAIAAKRFFKKTRTPIAVEATPIKLHVNGMFHYTRNPMYLGITVALLGWAMLLSSFFNFVFPVLFLLIMNRYFVPKEESALAQKFGDDYLRYKTAVPRWI